MSNPLATLILADFYSFSTLSLLVMTTAASVLVLIAYFLVPLLFSSLNKFPGPLTAAVSRLWVAYYARYGVRSLKVEEQHRKFGTFVRIGPNEISIASPDALPLVYAHGGGSLKSDFYDAFVSLGRRGLFNTRDRHDHSRKRKIVSNVFSAKSVAEFMPYIESTVRILLKKWDGLCEKGLKNGSEDGREYIESLDWFNALAFDVIGDLAFGQSFGMLERDAADLVAITQEDGTIIYSAAVKILNERGEFSATQGALPPWVRPYTKYMDPWFARGLKSVQNLAGIAVNRVDERVKTGSGDRTDILSLLLASKDSEGKPMGKAELTVEALTNLIAGSDTTSNSSCAILFFILRHPRVHAKLFEELHAVLGPRDHDGTVEYEDAKTFPYLLACINEALRRHSTSGIGLPRIMAEDIEICGEVFKAGTILSVPSYTLHHLDSVWSDPFVYRPERWLEEGGKDLEKSLNIFSYGPRSCVGRNVAMAELLVFISTIIYRYDIKLKDEIREELEVTEGFLRKPLGCIMGLKRRKIE